MKTIIGFPYTVRSHAHYDDKFVTVTIHCLSYPTYGAQPVEWDFVLHVPKDDLGNWPLGATVRLEVQT